MPITKSRQIAKLLKLDGTVKDSLYDSDAIVTSAQLGVAAAAGTTVYSSADTLPTSATNGDQALVSSTNRLYIYSNGGWYNIALINNNPYWITEANSSYELSRTGAATTITLLAQDSDGINVVYTATADSDFNQIATVSKDSDNGRTFTIIPTDSENGTAIAGTGTVTFRASDGVNLVSTLSTFTIVFQISNSNYTTLLLKNEETSDNQVDASSSARTITENGDVTSTAFTPYHPGGYSTYLDGTSNANIQVKGESTLAVGTGNFSVSCWYKSDGALVSTVLASSVATAVSGVASQLYWNISVQSNGALFFQTRSSANSGLQYWGKSAAGLITANTWHHLVFARIGGVHYCAVDGVEDTTVDQDTATINITTQELAIGLSNITDYESYGTGYIRDFNFCTGGVEYDLSAGNYTVPNEPISPHANTKFLLGGLPYITDTSASPLTIDIIGSAIKTVRVGPYVYSPYNKADYGGSVYFDGTGDYLSASNSTDFDIAGDLSWTIEGWFYWNSISGEQTLIEKFTGGTGPGWTLYIHSGANIGFYSGSNGAFNNAIDTVTTGQWYHVAVSRDATTDKTRAFVNGQLKVDSTYSVGNNSSGNLYIGTRNGSANYMNGYVSDVRVINGTALYTADFTPPTAPLTAITNTQLLTCTNKNDIWDAAGGIGLSKSGNVTGGANSGTLKFGKTAIYFDGTDDHLEITDMGISGDLTFEFWFYQNVAQSAAYRWLFGTDIYDASNPIGIYTYNTNVQVWLVGSGSAEITGSFTAQTWHHVAVVRNSGTWTLYIDGTSQGTSTSYGSTDFADTVDWWIGERPNGLYDFNGYMQDIRITNGLARYTGNFTPPTAEFDG